MTISTGVNFDQVSSVALDMLSNGVKPTVRGVIKVTGGKTETVSGLLRDFFDKRDADVSKMAGELGSSSIAAILASEIQIVVDSKTKSLSEIVERQKSQIAEMVELLNEKETDCQHRAELAEAQSKLAIDDAAEKVKVANERIETAEQAKSQADKELDKVRTESNSAIDTANKSAQQAIEIATNNADALVVTAEQKATILVDSAKGEADALVKAATTQIDKAEAETKTLRLQVKDLMIDQAKHELEQAQFDQAKSRLEQQQIDIAEQKTLVVQLQTEQRAFVKDTTRLEGDLVNAKENAAKLSQAQTQLVEMQKQLSQAQHDLSQSERERDSLALAVAASNKEDK
jgi:hypothetical protein